MNKLLSMISLSRKAGKLLMGFDRVKESIYGGAVHIVLTASDLSEKSRKEIAFICEAEDMPCLELPITMDELGWEIGKRTGILAVTEPGLAGKIRGMMNCETEN